MPLPPRVQQAILAALLIVPSMARILMPAMHLAMPFAQLHAQLVALLGGQLSLR